MRKKIRVIAGSLEFKDNNGNDQLLILYQTKKLIIQGSNDVLRIPLSNGRQAFFVGSLIGMRTGQGDIIPLNYYNERLKEIIETNTIKSLGEILEGKYLIVITGPDDICEICADRYGQFDLYYQTVDSATTFSSDLSFLPVSQTGGDFDQIGLTHVLNIYGYRPPKRHTLYRSVRRLGVKETVRINKEGIEFIEIPFKPIHTDKYGERELNEYAELFLDSVFVRGSQYGNLIYLSSGWDSTAILAGLIHLFGRRKVRGVIGRMQYSDRAGVINQFELDRAKSFADYYGIPLDIVEFDYRHRLPELFDSLQPTCRSHNITSINIANHGILAEYAARTTSGNESVFSGEISDGAHNLGFSQFVSIFHSDLNFREYSDKMASYLFGPTFFGLFKNDNFFNDPVYKLFRDRAGNAVFDGPVNGTPNNRAVQLLASFFLRPSRLPLWSLNNCQMLTERGAFDYSKEMESIYLHNASEELTQDTLYAWYLHLYNSFHWQGSTITTLPLTAEAFGLDCKLPFWDSRIQEFLSAMPEEWGRGLDLNPTKYPLKWFLKNKIDYPFHLQRGPHSYLYDVNPNFSHTTEILYASAFTPRFKDLLGKRSYNNILSPGTFNISYIDAIVDKYLKGEETRGLEMKDLFSLCMLMMTGWYE